MLQRPHASADDHAMTGKDAGGSDIAESLTATPQERFVLMLNERVGDLESKNRTLESEVETLKAKVAKLERVGQHADQVSQVVRQILDLTTARFTHDSDSAAAVPELVKLVAILKE